MDLPFMPLVVKGIPAFILSRNKKRNVIIKLTIQSESISDMGC